MYSKGAFFIGIILFFTVNVSVAMDPPKEVIKGIPSISPEDLTVNRISKSDLDAIALYEAIKTGKFYLFADLPDDLVGVFAKTNRPERVSTSVPNGVSSLYLSDDPRSGLRPYERGDVDIKGFHFRFEANRVGTTAISWRIVAVGREDEGHEDKYLHVETRNGEDILTLVTSDQANNRSNWDVTPVNAASKVIQIVNRETSLQLNFNAGLVTSPNRGLVLETASGNGETVSQWRLVDARQPISYNTESGLTFLGRGGQGDLYYCPTILFQGDREFNGNGPFIRVHVALAQHRDYWKYGLGLGSTGEYSTDIYDEVSLLIDIKAKETKSDWTETDGLFIENVLSLANGWSVDEFYSPSVDALLYESKEHGEVTFSFNNALGQSHGLSEDGLLRKVSLVGDTQGTDVSDGSDCDDDLRVTSIELNPISMRVTYDPNKDIN